MYLIMGFFLEGVKMSLFLPDREKCQNKARSVSSGKHYSKSMLVRVEEDTFFSPVFFKEDLFISTAISFDLHFTLTPMCACIFHWGKIPGSLEQDSNLIPQQPRTGKSVLFKHRYVMFLFTHYFQSLLGKQIYRHVVQCGIRTQNPCIVELKYLFIYLFPGKKYIQRIGNKNMTTQRTSLWIIKKRK